MPVVSIAYTGDELAQLALSFANEIVRLADLEKAPLAPGETADARRHKIASLGVKLANVFIAIDKFMTAMSGGGEQQPVTVDLAGDDKPGAN